MAKNTDLTTAKKRKKDEFYTQVTDIEKELRHYKGQFVGKTVLCNCDDPRISGFFKFFSEKFEELGLKKLIATCYCNTERDLFSLNADDHGICQVYEGDRNGNLVVDDEEVAVRRLNGNGDFRSAECIELLKESDIVVTNPPFSLFREFVETLFKYDKKFLIIGNVNAISCKGVFERIMNEEMWLGASIHSGDREFGVPEDYPLEAAGCRVDEHGKRFIRVKGVRWFTNLDYRERHEKLILYRNFNEENYPRFDNFDAIEVGETTEIPCDYSGVMGVPITFLDKYCPDQFEIVGITKAWFGAATKHYPRQVQVNPDGTKKEGVSKLNDGASLCIESPLEKKACYKVGDRYYRQVYPRILIRKRKESDK